MERAPLELCRRGDSRGVKMSGEMSKWVRKLAVMVWREKRENLSDGRAYGDARSVVGIVLARRSQRYIEEVLFG